MCDLKNISKGFSAIGSEQRLLVFLTLVKQLPDGLSIGDIQKLLDMKPSTLAHHIKLLVETNLVTQEKRGKEVYNFANVDELNTLCDFIVDQCCLLNKESDLKA